MLCSITALAGASPPPSDDERYRTVVTDETEADPAAAQRRLDARTPGFGTAVPIEGGEAGARPQDGLAEVLARSPGASVRSLGGLGQFSSVSLRGSSAQQVQISIDGVPIASSLAGLVDVGAIPLDGLERADVYRGHVPVELGGTAIGGAIDLVSREVGDQARISAHGGMGSFGARDARLRAEVPLPRSLGLSAELGYAGAQGSFPFHDTAGTPNVVEDDGEGMRRNNAYDRIVAQSRLSGRRGRWRFWVRPLALWKRQGIPGPASAQSNATELTTADGRVIARAVRSGLGGPGGRLTWVAGLGAAQRRFADPLGEVGLSVDDQRTRALDLYASPRVRVPVWRGAFLGLSADLRGERVWIDERAVESAQAAETSGDAQRARLGFGVGAQLEQFLWGERALLVPIFRADALDSRFGVAAGQGEQGDRGRDIVEVGLSPRLGARVRLVDGLSLRGSVGRYFRPPTLIELFGDRGYAIGNEGLSAERGTAFDGGLVLDHAFGPPRGAPVRLYAHAAGFATWTQDLIQWISTGSVVQPTNVEGARIVGLESSVSLDALARAIVVQANYTLVESRNLSRDPAQRGAPLPGRPRHEAFARLSTGWDFARSGTEIEPRAFYTLDAASGTYLDPSGRYEIPARVLHGVGAELHVAGRLHLAFEVRNLLDTRVTSWRPAVAGAGELPVPLADFIGYPLPGRSLWATLGLDLPLSARRAKDPP